MKLTLFNQLRLRYNGQSKKLTWTDGVKTTPSVTMKYPHPFIDAPEVVSLLTPTHSRPMVSADVQFCNSPYMMNVLSILQLIRYHFLVDSPSVFWYDS